MYPRREKDPYPLAASRPWDARGRWRAVPRGPPLIRLAMTPTSARTRRECVVKRVDRSINRHVRPVCARNDSDTCVWSTAEMLSDGWNKNVRVGIKMGWAETCSRLRK